MPKIGDIKYTHRAGKPLMCDRSIWVACPQCEKGRWSQYYRWLHHPDMLCHLCAMRIAAQKRRGKYIGEKSGRWKGGRRRRTSGYIEILVRADNPYHCMAGRDGYVSEHRLVMAQYLERPLLKEEQVHHLNGIKIDNRLKNLAIVNAHNHQHNTLVVLLQEHIRGLEAELSQKRFNI